jgi:hypothetical protein
VIEKLTKENEFMIDALDVFLTRLEAHLSAQNLTHDARINKKLGLTLDYALSLIGYVVVDSVKPEHIQDVFDEIFDKIEQDFTTILENSMGKKTIN